MIRKPKSTEILKSSIPMHEVSMVSRNTETSWIEANVTLSSWDSCRQGLNLPRDPTRCAGNHLRSLQHLNLPIDAPKVPKSLVIFRLFGGKLIEKTRKIRGDQPPLFSVCTTTIKREQLLVLQFHSTDACKECCWNVQRGVGTVSCKPLPWTQARCPP